MAGTSTLAEELRDRARELRRLAAAIDAAEATELYRRAGVATWVGPTPAQCADELASARRQLIDAAQTLRTTARRAEIRADQAEVSAQRLALRLALRITPA